MFYAYLLLLYHEMGVHSVNYLELVPDLIDGELEWEIEAILDFRQSEWKDKL